MDEQTTIRNDSENHRATGGKEPIRVHEGIQIIITMEGELEGGLTN